MIDNLSTFRHRPNVTPLANATRWAILRGRIREAFADWLDRRGVPGLIKPMTYTDGLTGQTIIVRVSGMFTVLTVNGRDYYFRRFSGELDGTGMSV